MKDDGEEAMTDEVAAGKRQRNAEVRTPNKATLGWRQVHGRVAVAVAWQLTQRYS